MNPTGVQFLRRVFTQQYQFRQCGFSGVAVAQRNIETNLPSSRMYNETSLKPSKLDINSLNTSLQSMIARKESIDVPKFLHQLEENDVEPDTITCELLSKVYALQANSAAILNLLSVVRQSGQSPTCHMMENLAYAEASIAALKLNETDEEENCKKLECIHRVVHIFNRLRAPKRNIYFSVRIYLSAALAFAQHGNLNLVTAALNSANNIYKNELKPFNNLFFYRINEIYFNLLDSGCDCNEVLNALRPYLTLAPGLKDGEILTHFSIAQVIPFVNSIRKKNNASFRQLRELLRAKFQFIVNKSDSNPKVLINHCITLLEKNQIDDFCNFVRERHEVTRTNGEFFWVLLVKYFGSEEKLCEEFKRALTIYLKISQPLNNKSIRKLHRYTLMNFLQHAYRIDQEAESAGKKLYYFPLVLKVIENCESPSISKIYEERILALNK